MAANHLLGRSPSISRCRASTWFGPMSDDLRIAESDLRRVLRHLERRTSFAEAMAERVRGEHVSVDSRAVNAAAVPPREGVVIRAWTGMRWAETAVTSLEGDALSKAAEGLGAQLVGGEPGKPPPGEPSTTIGAFDTIPARPMRTLGTESTLERLREVYRWITEEPSIKFGQSTVRWQEEERYYLNTAGASCFQRLDRVLAAAVAVAVENGRSESDFTALGALGGQEVLEPIDEEMARTLSKGARDLLGSKTPPSGLTNVLLDPGTTGTFAHESFGHGTEADQFVRHRSYLQPLLGQAVGPEYLTLVDDGSIPGAWGSIHYDDEGHPGQRTVLVDRGRFVGALHDRNTAAALGATPTGNTRRSDFLSPAYVRMTNTLVEPGDWSFEELVKETRDGILLEHWQSGMEDPQGGQMQLKVCKGHRIENGEVTDLLSSMALSGSVLQFLKDIRGIGKATDSSIAPGNCGKGHGDLLPTGDGGTYLLSRAWVGPS